MSRVGGFGLSGTDESAFASVRTDTYRGTSCLFDSMETSIDMIAGFAAMLDHTLRSGEDFRSESFGITSILNSQCEELRFLRGALIEQLALIRKSKLKTKDIRQVATMAGVPVEIAARIVSFATGVNYYRNGKLDLAQAEAREEAA